MLPDDIRVVDMHEVAPAEFHARRDAKSKVYQYRIWHGARDQPVRLPLRPSLAVIRSPRADAPRGRPFSTGRTIFHGFSSNRDFIRSGTVYALRARRRGDELVYTIEASGFLRYMVRTIVGTLLEVGRGRIAPDAIEDIFRKTERTLASPTAPAKGLCLLKIVY